MLLIIPKVTSLSSTARRARTVAVVLLLGKIMPSPYSRCAKEGLIYITLASPLSRQPFSYLECTKANIYLSYNVRSISNAKYIYPIILNSLRVP